MSEQHATLPITGMTCANCATNIERTVKKLDGISEVMVNFAGAGQGQLRSPAGQISAAWCRAFKRPAMMWRGPMWNLPITGMTCANCAATCGTHPR